MRTLNCICLTLTIIGAIVWGIIGLFSYNIIDGIFGVGTAFSRIIYTLVGVIVINIQKMPTDTLIICRHFLL